MTINKDLFLTQAKLNGPHHVDGLGEVYIREVSCEDASYVYKADESDIMDSPVRIIISCVCDADGQPVFSQDDYAALRKTPAERVRPLVELVTAHSGFGADIEAIVGNSEATT